MKDFDIKHSRIEQMLHNWLQVLELQIIKFDVIFKSSMNKLTDVTIFSKTRLKIKEIG
jgi:hypothetical protein